MLRTEPDTAYDAFRATRHFGSLDGLKALSIAAVLWHHSNTPTSAALLDRGQLGVHLFFAISGFLITTLLLREKERCARISLTNFYVRRGLRIFPLYYAVVGVYIAAVLVFERDSEVGRRFFDDLPYFLTYTGNVAVELRERTIFYFSWSLATEEQFYLLFPSLVAFAAPRLALTVLGIVVAVVFCNHVGVLQPMLSRDSLGSRILWQVAPCITLGAACAYAMNDRRGFRVLHRLLGHRASAPLALVTCLAIAAQPPAGMLHEYAIYVSLVALVAAATIREDNGLSRGLQMRWLKRIGVISYGMYMMHMLCFHVGDTAAGLVGAPAWIGRLTVGVLLTVAVAELSFRFFESRFLAIKQRFAPPVVAAKGV